MKRSVKEVIADTLRYYPIELNDAVIIQLDEKVRTRANAHGDTLEGFAYTVARNWAISMMRKKTAAAKRQAAAFLTAERQREEQELLDRCRKEFDTIVLQLLSTLHHTQPKQLAVARLVYFEGGLPLARFAELFPGATEHQRYQWITRGVRLVLPHASQELEEFLRGNART